jgi:hypothetical protein
VACSMFVGRMRGFKQGFDGLVRKTHVSMLRGRVGMAFNHVGEWFACGKLASGRPDSSESTSNRHPEGKPCEAGFELWPVTSSGDEQDEKINVVENKSLYIHKCYSHDTGVGFLYHIVLVHST